MWDLPGSAIDPMSPALAGGFFITEPPGKSYNFFFLDIFFKMYLFLAVLGLRGHEGFSPVAVLRLLIAVASLVAEHQL